MSPVRPPRVVVIGGGITGLSAAYYIKQGIPECDLTLLESKSRLGGNIWTVERDGFLLDGGPDSFLRTKPRGIELCHELGLEDELITTRDEGRHVYLVHEGKLEQLPAGLLLGVPTRFGPMMKTPLLSWIGKVRALSEVLLPANYGRSQAPEDDESLFCFIERRLGTELAERIAAPLLSGIFAGDARALSVSATFPQLREMEQKDGGLIRGFFASQRGPAKANGSQSLSELWSWLNRAAANPPSPFVSFRGGMHVLVKCLVERLEPAKLLVDTPAAAVRSRKDGAWSVTLADGTTLDADAVLLATPAGVTAALLGEPPITSALEKVPYKSTATVFFALNRAEVEHPLDGLGFMSDGSRSVIAGTWVSSKWEHRAPQGKVLIRAFLGGAGRAEEVEGGEDRALVATARAGLEDLMGSLGRPLFTQVFRHVRASPQLLVGHPARILQLRQRLAAHKGLYLAGAAYEGIGIPDCVDQARSQSARLIEELC